MRLTKIILVIAVAVALGVSGNAASGGPSSELAIQRFDQNLLDAWTAKLSGSDTSMPRVNGYEVERRVPLFLFSYYRGQSTVEDHEISCSSRDSIVLWYGTDAVLVWQEGLWFPDRPSVHQKYATSGLLQ